MTVTEQAAANRAHVRIRMRQRFPELARRLNEAVRRMPCGPHCRKHPPGSSVRYILPLCFTGSDGRQSAAGQEQET